MPAKDSQHVRYVLIRVANSGRTIGTVYKDRELSVRYFKASVRMSPIWCALIRYNKQTGEAETLERFQGPTVNVD